MTRNAFFLALATVLALTACKTVPEPEAPVIVIPPKPVQTCAPVSALTRVVIPAETKTQTAITMIDNPPYEPIESRTTRIVVVKPAQVFYVDSEGKEVLDICDKGTIELGDTGPGVGAIIPET